MFGSGLVFFFIWSVCMLLGFDNNLIVGPVAVVLVAVGPSIGVRGVSVAVMSLGEPAPGGLPAMVGGSVIFDARVPDIVLFQRGCDFMCYRSAGKVFRRSCGKLQIGSKSQKRSGGLVCCHVAFTRLIQSTEKNLILRTGIC